MSAPVVHFEILGKDGEKLKDFYSSIFGWKINSDNPHKYGVVEAGEGGIGGGVGSPGDDHPGHVTVYINVENIEASLGKVEEMGGTTAMAPIKIDDNMSIALFRDPENNLIGLITGGSST